MNKKHIITIAGRPGSGKSSTGKAVASKLGYKHFSAGDLFRALGKEKGVDVLQANLSAEGNYELDHLVDGKLQEIGVSEDNLVVDSRTAWHWIPGSFRVFLNLDLKVAAERILNGMDDARLASEQIDRDPEAYAKLLGDRLDSENKRYKLLYDIDPYDLENYDLVVDTAANNLESVVELVLTEYQNWLKKSR